METNRSLFNWLITIELILLFCVSATFVKGDSAGALLPLFIFVFLPALIVFIILCIFFTVSSFNNRNDQIVIKRFKLFWFQLSMLAILYFLVGLFYFK
jgi:hypothetical protein